MPRHTIPDNEIHPFFRHLMQLHGCETLTELARRCGIEPHQRLIGMARRTEGHAVLKSHLEMAEAFGVPPEDWVRALADGQ